jgi:hypothetical protein
MAKTWLDGAAIVESGVKMFTPEVITPGPSETPCLMGLSSMVFHCSSNPDWLIVSGEMLTSVRIHDVRCASAEAVGHSVGLPRLCPPATTTAAIAAASAANLA